MERLTLNVAEVAEALGLSTWAVYDLVARGVLDRVPHTKRVLIPRRSLEKTLPELFAPRATVLVLDGQSFQ